MEQINLNLIPNGILAVCHVSQYDNTGRKIRFHLFNGSDTYALSGTETITLRIRKTNGEILIFDIANTASDYIELTVLQQMSDVSGVSVCEFRLTDSGLDIGSFNFKMKVEPDAFDGNLSISEVSGPIATFETDLAEDLIKLDVDLEPIQDLHGYDNPWPAGGGKNVYPLIAPDTKNGITLTNDNGVITLNGTATADVYFDIDNLNISLPTGSKLYLCAFNSVAAETRLSLFLITNNIGNPQVNMNNTNAILDTTISADAIGTRLRLRVPNGATYSNFKLSPYLQIGGDTPTSFTPYSNICAITGHTEAKIVRAGENLLNIDAFKDINNWNTSYPNSGSMPATNSNPIYTIGKLVAGQTYTLSFEYADPDFPRYLYFGYYDDEGKTTRLTYFTTSQIFNRTYTFTALEDMYYCIRIQGSLKFDENMSYINKCQFEEGSSQTSYKPYTGLEVTVQFGQIIYKGVLDVKNSKVIATHVCETYDGSLDEEWVRHSATSVRYGFRIYFQNNKKATAQAIDEMLSSVIPLRKSSETASVDDDIITCRSTTYLHKIFYIFAPPSKISTVEELRAFLANEPETVMYPLNEPIEIPLSAISPIPALVGTNNVYSDAGDVDVEYYTTLEGGND